jgi:hypothetical protein
VKRRLFALIALAPAAASAASITLTMSDDKVPAVLEALGMTYNGPPASPGPAASPGPPSVAPGPTQPVPPLCKGFGSLLPIINATWGKQASWLSTQVGNFGDNTVWVIKLVVPVGTPNSTSSGSFTTAEYLGPNTPRQLTISKHECDFRARDYTGANGPLTICQDGTSCQVSYAVQTPRQAGNIAGLAAAQTYYVNVRNWSNFPPPPAYDCGQTTCNAIMNFQPATP